MKVILYMTNVLTGKPVQRTIDAVNAMVSGSECWELRGKDSQRKQLENWIAERGNDQHDTLLQLDSWDLIK